MRVLVCGGRDFPDRGAVYDRLDAFHAFNPISVIISGGANGVDNLAADWAAYRQVKRETYCADWERHGRAAGPIRNQRMLDDGRPEIVIAFRGGPGTADMVRRARGAGIKVLEPQ